ncbi:MAG: HAD family hydrolase [Bacilli bacterium]|nr:HAD family hydrolase [Bacilli bacterium]
MKKFKLYIIDFDGTLIDSYKGLPIFYRTAFGAIGYDVSDEEAYHFSKISLQAAFIEKVNKEELIPAFKQASYNIIDTKVLLPYNVPFLDTLPFINYIKDNKLDCALVTGNAIRHVNMVLDNLSINDFLKVKVTSEDLKKQKPDPEGINLVMKNLHYSGELKDVCYIGDSYNDYLAAKAAGVTPILLDRYQEFKENEDYILIKSLEELIA